MTKGALHRPTAEPAQKPASLATSEPYDPAWAEELRLANRRLRRANTALEASREKYRALFNNMSEAFVLGEPILDAHGTPVDFRWLEVNDAFGKQTGLSRDILGKPARSFLPRLEQSWIDRYGRVALTGQPEHFQDFNVDTNRWYEAYCFSPSPGKFAVIGRDVSDRLRMEQALRDSEAVLRATFEQAGVGITRVSTDGFFLRVNRKFCEMTGYTEDEVCRRHITDIAYPPDRDIAIPEFHALIAGKITGYTREKRYLRKDGRIIWVRITTSSIRDPDTNEARYNISIIEDITEQKAAEEALRRERAQVQAILDNASVLISMKDLQGNMVVANRALFEVLKVSPPEQFIGRSVFDVFPPEVASESWANDLEALKADAPIRVEEHVQHRDGSWHTYLSVKFPVRDSEGSPPYAICAISTDITERKRLEQEVQQANRELESRVAQRTAELRASNTALSQEVAHRREIETELREAKQAAEAANRAKSDFLATMSHEIRTPLNGVIGFNGLLLDGPLTEDKRHFAELARRSGETLLQLLNDFLDFSKIEAGRLELELTEFDPRQEVDNALALIEGAAAQKGLPLQREIVAPACVRGDPARLRQILLNLLSNAVKFTSQGQVRLSCRETTRDGAKVWLRFDVSDTGIGIAPDVQQRLFQPFVQADASTTRRFGGTGLGLVICRHLTEAMGGRISLVSTPGQGSTFTVELPFELRTETAPSRDAGAPLAQGEHFLGRLLVAEDDPVSQLLAAELLKRLGLRVDVVGNGKEALEALHKLPYDLVLMDCHMPVMDGLAATRAIRAAEGGRQHVPVVAMTAAVLRGDIEACQQAGMDDFMGKPIRLQELIRILRKWLAREAMAQPS